MRWRWRESRRAQKQQRQEITSASYPLLGVERAYPSRREFIIPRSAPETATKIALQAKGFRAASIARSMAAQGERRASPWPTASRDGSRARRATALVSAAGLFQVAMATNGNSSR